MFVSDNQILTTQKEAISLIDYLLKCLWWVDTESYVKTLSLALHQIIILEQPLHKDRFNWINNIGHRVGIEPPHLKKSKGLYYRQLYDQRFQDERPHARRQWRTKVINHMPRKIEEEWPNPIRVFDKMRLAEVHPHKIAELTNFVQTQNPYALPDQTVTTFGELKVIQ